MGTRATASDSAGSTGPTSLGSLHHATTGVTALALGGIQSGLLLRLAQGSRDNPRIGDINPAARKSRLTGVTAHPGAALQQEHIRSVQPDPEEHEHRGFAHLDAVIVGRDQERRSLGRTQAVDQRL